MTDAIALARLIESLPPKAIARALIASGTSASHAGDVFDAAEFLDRPDTVDARLRWITSEQATRLRALSDGAAPSAQLDAELRELVLVDATGRPLDSVLTRLSPSPEPDAVQAGPTTGIPTSTEQPATLTESTRRGFATTRLVYGLLVNIGDKAPHALGRGGLARADRLHLASFLGIDDDTLAIVIALAESSHLVGRTANDSVVRTARAREWMRSSDTERLTALVDGWRSALPAALLRAVSDAWKTSTSTGNWWAQVAAELPFGGTALEAYREPVEASGRLLGLVDARGITPLGTAILDPKGRDVSTLVDAEILTIDYVYPQADSTIIAPGILRHDIEERLLTCARCTQFGDASTYTLSQGTIATALSHGVSSTDLEEFLDGISRGGLPQPLRYLIHDTAARFGEVRVSATDDGSHIQTANPVLAASLLHDRTLAALALRPTTDDETHLVSRMSADVVVNAILDARYSVIRVGADGNIRYSGSEIRHEADPSSARIGMLFPPSEPEQRIITIAHNLAEHIHAHVQDAAPSALHSEHLTRQLELAIKRRHAVRIIVAMPDESHVEFDLEPTGIGGGRLRGRDPKAQTERTFPISHIRSVELAGSITS